MVFPQLPSYVSSQSQDNVNTAQQIGLDSITLGQLKAMVGSAPKPKACLQHTHKLRVSLNTFEKVAVVLRLQI